MSYLKKKKLAETRDINEIWIAYAKGLVNLTAKQEKEEMKQTVELLKELAEIKDINEIWVSYVNGIYNILILHEIEEKRQTIKLLKNLAESRNITDIWDIYAYGFASLLFDLDSFELDEILKNERNTFIQQSDNIEISAAYGIGLLLLLRYFGWINDIRRNDLLEIELKIAKVSEVKPNTCVDIFLQVLFVCLL